MWTHLVFLSKLKSWPLTTGEQSTKDLSMHASAYDHGGHRGQKYKIDNVNTEDLVQVNSVWVHLVLRSISNFSPYKNYKILLNIACTPTESTWSEDF